MSICCCRRCGKKHIEENTTICTSCVEREENEFQTIKDFLEIHPFATVFEVAVSLDVSIKSIKCYLRDCRLELVERDNQKNILLTCEKCGAPIPSGHYCTACENLTPHNYKSFVGIQSNKAAADSKDTPSKTNVTYYQASKKYA